MMPSMIRGLMPFHNNINSYDSGNLIFDKSRSTVVMDFLMPTGIIIQCNVDTHATLSEIKGEVWDRAREHPLFGLLHDQMSYHFVCISSKAETLELLDENQCLKDVDLFMKVLRVVERKGNEEEKRLNNQIAKLIGKGLQDFEALKNPEVNDFRSKMRRECNDVVRARNNKTWGAQVLYQHPCQIAKSDDLPKYIIDRMPNKMLYVGVHFTKTENLESKFTIPVPHDILPSALIDLALAKKLRTFEGDLNYKAAASEHILKLMGREEYLILDYPLSQFASVREHICQNQIQNTGTHGQQNHLHVILVKKSSINVHIDEIYGKIEDCSTKPTRASISASTINKKKNRTFISSWNVQSNFSIKLGALSKLLVESEELSEVFLELGLYHASNALCTAVQTHSFNVDKQTSKIDTDIEFPIEIKNIPRSTRLCIGVFEQRFPNQKSKDKNMSSIVGKYANRIPIGWVNTTVYDYRGELKTGSVTLYCWNLDGEHLEDFDIPNPLGPVVSNPNHDRALAITVTFNKHSNLPTIVYPSKEIIINRAERNRSDMQPPITNKEKDEIEQIVSRDPLCELHEQEKKTLWTHRRYCQEHQPDILSKLIQCVEWDSNEEVAEIISLLDDWKKLPPNIALELLDYAYPEPTVRFYAIECIEKMSDDDLLLYLLQLVQAIKHENYLYCDLVQFLLQRALQNQRIGHFLFWHLRSEMHVPSVSIRFGLILEAYCRGAVEHMKLLQKQCDAIVKMRDLQDIVRNANRSKEKVNLLLQETISSLHFRTPLSDVLDPIDPTLRISSVRSEKCKSMDSKMQPLWLVFRNNDPLGTDICVLYKRGDDLRQDMLTLQMIRVMDKIWKDSGLDLRMTPYSCLSTNLKEGIIQVVTTAKTIANIQRMRGGIAPTLQKTAILDWLREHNRTPEALENAIHEFTLSCAGYSVATYVLGIADRHNDNIMIRPNGQLFHIDFGHILGHYKEKLGIRRERQPFVLTYDIIHVIQKGLDSKEKTSESFIEFKRKCEEAYMALRRQGSFIISLFAMMISTGLPELQGEKDLNYLREALKLGSSDKEALEHFQSKFKEALRNITATVVNWTFHYINRQ